MDPPFDLASYGRHGPGRRDHLSPAQIQQIARTVERTPEVMVKVLSHGAINLGAVRRHLDYIGRKGDVDLETDEGQTLRGRQTGQLLVEDWDLELDALRRRADLVPGAARSAPRLVHKLMFSMPPGTPPAKVLQAVQNLCREEFALRHRYAMALHTDEPHPHVHVVVKAVSEQDKRLHIRKQTLRDWRAQFAQHLTAVGVAANATPRYVRGETAPRKSDGIYRASLRGASIHMRERAVAAARQLLQRKAPPEPGKAKQLSTRENVLGAWWMVSETLIRSGRPELAAQVKRFAEKMPPPMTDQEWLAGKLSEHVRPHLARDGPTH